MLLRTLRLLRNCVTSFPGDSLNCTRARSQDFALFTNPSEAIVKHVPVHLQMELVDLQSDGDLKSKLDEVPLVKLYGE